MKEDQETGKRCAKRQHKEVETGSERDSEGEREKWRVNVREVAGECMDFGVRNEEMKITGNGCLGVNKEKSIESITILRV